nr:ferric reductase [Actinomycetota bacterium]
SVILGVLLSARTRFTWPRFAVEEVHRFLAILTGAFVALHGASLLLDRVVPISLGQMLVPFSSPYRPFAVGLGAAAAELMAAVGISNHFRKQMPHRLWRRIHYLTLGVWVLATAHGVLAGSDGTDPWFAGVAAASVAAVGLAFAVRCSVRGRAWLTGTA